MVDAQCLEGQCSGSVGDVPAACKRSMEDKRTDAPAQNLNDSHAVRRLHPSQGGAPVRGNELLIGPGGSMQQHHRDFCSWMCLCSRLHSSSLVRPLKWILAQAHLLKRDEAKRKPAFSLCCIWASR